MGSIVNKQQLAEILGVDTRTLTNWADEGLPILVDGKRGQQNQYDTESVIYWMIQREINQRIKRHGGESEFYDYEMERARLTFHQANMAGMDEKLKSEQLVPADDVRETWTNLIMACRSRMLAIPTKAAHHFQALTDLNQIQDCLQEHIYEALDELANYDPEQDCLDAGSGDYSVNQTAAKTNGQRVG